MNGPDFDTSRCARKGMLIASLCLAHCIAGPVLLSVAGLASLISISERLEPLFLLGSAAMGAIALVPAYRSRHGRVSCLAMFGSGLVCFLLRRHIGGQAAFAESVAAFLGATLIIGAHALNLKFSRRCQCCKSLRDRHQARQGTATGSIARES